MPVGGEFSLAGFTVSAQQANVAAGTAFAFLIKACLMVAVRTAYTQVFWASVAGASTTVSRLDTLAAVLQNVLLLLSGTVWWRWLLPSLLPRSYSSSTPFWRVR